MRRSHFRTLGGHGTMGMGMTMGMTPAVTGASSPSTSVSIPVASASLPSGPAAMTESTGDWPSGALSVDCPVLDAQL